MTKSPAGDFLFYKMVQMKKFEFHIKEIVCDGYIAWTAVEGSTNKEFPVNIDGYFRAGSFPEISDYLKKEYGINFNVIYIGSGYDSFEQSSNIWQFTRGETAVIVKDIPRTVFRVTMSSS